MAVKAGKKKVKKFDEVCETLELVKSNHLPHLQAGIDLVAAKQDKTNLELAEQTGYLKAIADSVRK